MASLYEGLNNDMMQDETHNRSRDSVHANAWYHMREIVGKLHLPATWSRQFQPTSLVTHNHKRTVYVKVTIGGEVYVDRKQRDFTFLSEKHVFPHVEDACRKAKEILLFETGQAVRVYE